MIRSDGKIPAQPCIPAVVPNPATKLAVPWSTPSFFVSVSIVIGRHPTLEREVNAISMVAKDFFMYTTGFRPLITSKRI